MVIVNALHTAVVVAMWRSRNAPCGRSRAVNDKMVESWVAVSDCSRARAKT
jgi:hypothetical protein